MSEPATTTGTAPQSAAAPSPLGLYAEEFDVDTARHLGNFPQAFSHLALMEAAARIVAPELTAQY